MINKIEEQVLKLIDEINELMESAPEGKGWEKTVKGMKKHKEIDNPFALAHWMKKKGYKPKSEAVNPDGVGGVDPQDYDKRLAVLRAQKDAADPNSKLAKDLPQRIANLEKAKERALSKQFKTDTMK
jgi:hypothetical protein